MPWDQIVQAAQAMVAGLRSGPQKLAAGEDVRNYQGKVGFAEARQTHTPVFVHPLADNSMAAAQFDPYSTPAQEAYRYLQEGGRNEHEKEQIYLMMLRDPKRYGQPGVIRVNRDPATAGDDPNLSEMLRHEQVHKVVQPLLPAMVKGQAMPPDLAKSIRARLRQVGYPEPPPNLANTLTYTEGMAYATTDPGWIGMPQKEATRVMNAMTPYLDAGTIKQIAALTNNQGWLQKAYSNTGSLRQPGPATVIGLAIANPNLNSTKPEPMRAAPQFQPPQAIKPMTPYKKLTWFGSELGEIPGGQ